jgi:hypothetical protein
MGDITPVNNNNPRIANASDLTNDRTAVPETPPENENGDNEDGHAVDVEALRRTLSRTSSLHRVQSGQKSLEAPDDDDFDLKAYLVRHSLTSLACG